MGRRAVGVGKVGRCWSSISTSAELRRGTCGGGWSNSTSEDLRLGTWVATDMGDYWAGGFALTLGLPLLPIPITYMVFPSTITCCPTVYFCGAGAAAGGAAIPLVAGAGSAPLILSGGCCSPVGICASSAS